MSGTILDDLEINTTWFTSMALGVWDDLLPKVKPKKILEVGSFEGASACFVIRKIAAMHPIELHCIDTWAGGDEHKAVEMAEVERRFDRNIAKSIGSVGNAVDFQKHKTTSVLGLADLVAKGHSGTFDLIYIDGSHHAPDVLTDAVLAYQLAKSKGVIIFDDYLWRHSAPGLSDSLNWPKPGIDAFTNVFAKSTIVMSGPLYQLYVQKL